MIPANTCNYISYMSLLDYAYLSLNVYHNPKDLKLLGSPPILVHSLIDLKRMASQNKENWYQIQTPNVMLSTNSAFYADMYVKITNKHIEHVAIAVRGTLPKRWSNDIEDMQTWWKSVFLSGDHQTNTPSFYPLLINFLVSCEDVVGQLQSLKLLAHHCEYHLTGHSLGGALASLVMARGTTLLPGFNVVSFNAPGIGAMPHILKKNYQEGQVVSMRATYDFVSAISEPYGYVVNVKVPEHYQEAKVVFEQARGQPPASPAIYKHLLTTPGYAEYETGQLFGDLSVSLTAQHSMNHLLQAITTHPNVAHKTFHQLTAWSRGHGGFNHQETGVEITASVA